MNKEVLADTGYMLNVNSFLFAILINHVNEDVVEFSFDDFENKRRDFWNCGKPCFYAFTKEELESYLRNNFRQYINSNGEDRWIINLKEVFGNFINTLTDEEFSEFQYKEDFAKIYYLYCWLDIDMRIFDPPNNIITSLLRCNWMFDSNEKKLCK